MNVILSIKPKFAEAIFAGQKKYEYRKSSFRRKIDKVYLYASSPISKIVGEISIGNIISDSPDVLWHLTQSDSGISKEYFDTYFQERKIGYAISIISYFKYEEAIDPKTVVKTFKAPQSYIYIDPKIRIHDN